jgi:hypothetical protein
MEIIVALENIPKSVRPEIFAHKCTSVWVTSRLTHFLIFIFSHLAHFLLHWERRACQAPNTPRVLQDLNTETKYAALICPYL